MGKSCIACNRDISKDQKECFVCGAQQGFFRYHRQTISIFLLMLIGLGAAGKWYLDRLQVQNSLETQKLIAQAQTQSNQQLLTSQQRIKQLESELQTADQKLSDAVAVASQGDQKTNTMTAQLKAMEARATKAEGRAGWLNKENRRFQAKIKELEDRVAILESTQTTETIPTASVEQLQEELREFQGQRQLLLDRVLLTKTQLQAGWQANDSQAQPSAEMLAQRETQLKQATQVDEAQITQLDQQIAALELQIQQGQLADGDY